MTCQYHADVPKWEDRDWLYEQYWGNKQSAADIAQQLDVTDETIRHAMERYGIHRRVPYWKVQARPYDPRQDFGSDEDDDSEMTWVQMVDRDIVTTATS